jgi:hypothetical protein
MATLVMIEVDEILSAVMLSLQGRCAISTVTEVQELNGSTSSTTVSVAKDSSVPKTIDNVPPKSVSSDATLDVKEKIPKKKKHKPRVLKEEKYGIYTVQHLEATNFVKEWYKGFRATTPYILRLMKTYWSLSPTRASLLIGTNLLNTVLPSVELWISKSLLDQVHQAVKGVKPNLTELFGLALISAGVVALEHSLNLVTYFLTVGFV